MNKLIKRIRKIKHLEYILLSFILILGFIVRLYKITNPVADWHSWRQADTASVTRVYVEKGIDLFYPRYHDVSSIQTGIFNPEGLRFVEFPIYNAIHALLSKNFQFLSLEIWGRLISIFSALVSTYLVFLIGKRFIGKWGGVIAAFFFAFIPFNIYFTRVILPEPLSVTLALSGMWLFVKYIDEERGNLLFASGLLFALAMLVKPFTFFYLVPLVYLAHKKYGFKKILRTPKLLIRFSIFADLALIPFFAWRVWINQFPQGIPHFLWAFNGDKIRFKPSFWRWIFGERLGHLILGSWGLIPFSFGLLTAKKKEYFNHFFLLGVLLYLVIFATASVRHDYYQIFVIPAISLTLAQGSIYMWKETVFKKLSSRTLLVFSIGVMLITGALQVREFYKINHPEILQAGEALDKVAPKDSLVIAPYNGDTAFLYQTKRRGWPVVEESFDTVIEKGADYYVSVNLNDPDTKLLLERFEVVERSNTYVIIDLHKKI